MLSMESSASQYRLLVFDWDGTLMDSIATIVACTGVALQDAGFPETSESTIRRAVGMGLRDTAARFFPNGTEAQYLTMIERYRNHWLETFKDQPLLFAGVAPALTELAALGHSLAVATAKGRRGLERELASTGLLSVVDGSRTADECPAKPHPGMLHELMAEFGVSAAQTLMIGDTTYDLEMATNAGVGALGVLSGSHSEDELRQSRSLALLPSAAEVPAWLCHAHS